MDMVRRPFASGIVVSLLFAVAAFGPLEAQQPKYEGQTVTTIQFEPRDQPLEAAELHEILPLQMNRPLRMAEVRASIDRLFATGRYTDIQVDAQPYNGGVAITFKTKDRWFVGAVSIAGNVANPPGTGQLENATNLALGEAFSEAKLHEAVARQERLHESNGLFRSSIKPAVDYESTYG